MSLLCSNPCSGSQWPQKRSTPIILAPTVYPNNSLTPFSTWVSIMPPTNLSRQKGQPLVSSQLGANQWPMRSRQGAHPSKHHLKTSGTNRMYHASTLESSCIRCSGTKGSNRSNSAREHWEVFALEKHLSYLDNKTEFVKHKGMKEEIGSRWQSRRTCSHSLL